MIYNLSRLVSLPVFPTASWSIVPAEHSRLLRPAAPLALACVLTTTASAQRDLTDIPEPNPVAERAQMRVDELAAVNLFAADPDISKPIQVNFDSSGGLWVASSSVYPQIRPGEVADDKIIVLRDTDRDGVADTRTVFADGLLIPTGVLPDGPDAAYVAESTRLLYLQDTDGDGVADKRRVVFCGFVTDDTHHLVHTLRYGPDGCVYFNQSIYIHSHIETPYGTRHLDGGGIWRYRPSSGRLEVFCKGFINPWGHTFDPFGESFVTDGAYFEGINYAFPDAVFVTSPGATRWLKGLNPGSPKHCGLEILSGTHVPPEWSGDLVANDFRSHRVCRFTMKPSGSGYISRQQPEIITTQHVAFRPIDAKMGPDGALYVADWYNPIIQHGDVDFRDDRSDRTHGRIWRVSFPKRELDWWPNFASVAPAELVDLLEDPALPVRQFARQELWRHAASAPNETQAAIDRWAVENASDRNLERNWMYEVLAQPTEEDFGRLIDATRPAARRTLIRSLWRQRFELGADRMRGLEAAVLRRVLDEDPRVRLEAVLCAGQLDADDGLEPFRAVLGATQMDIDDNLDFAIWQSIRKLDASYDAGSMLTAMKWDDAPDQLAYAVSAIGTDGAAEVAVNLLETGNVNGESADALVKAIAAAGNASQLGRTVRALLSADPNNLSAGRLQPLLSRTFRDKTIPEGVGEILERIARQGELRDPRQLATLAKIAGVWRVEQLQPVLIDAVDDSQGEDQQRVIEALGAFDSAKVRDKLDQLSRASAANTRVAATRAILARRPRAAVGSIVQLLEQPETADSATAMVASLMNRKELPALLAKAIEQRQIESDLARNLLRQVRGSGGNEALETAIRKAGRLENASWLWSPQLRDELVAAASTDGSPARGEAIYRRVQLQCIQCHAIGSAGGLVGPNLISMGGSSQPDYIVESLLAPSAKLKEGYTTLSVLTDEGEVLNGIVTGRDEDLIRLRLADGKEVQVETETVEQEKPGKSLMPEGLLDSLTKPELVDLVSFLSALGRDPSYTVSTEPIVRSLETLVYSNEANRRLNRTSTDTAASDDPAMTWRPLTSKVDGTIPLDELDRFKQHRETPPTSFVRFSVELPDEGIAKIEFPTDGIEAWVDSKPTPVWDLASLNLTAGTHQIVLAIDRQTCTEPFTIRLGGDTK